MRPDVTETGRFYEIKVSGHLGLHRLRHFGSLAVTPEASGDTTIAGRLADQAALYGLLIQIRDLGVSLLSVRCVECDDTADDPPVDCCWSEAN